MFSPVLVFCTKKNLATLVEILTGLKFYQLQGRNLRGSDYEIDLRTGHFSFCYFNFQIPLTLKNNEWTLVVTKRKTWLYMYKSTMYITLSKRSPGLGANLGSF
jgi:hypothetical protein